MNYADMNYEQVIQAVDDVVGIKTEELDTEILRNMSIFTTIENIYAAHFKKLKKILKQKDTVEFVRWKHYAGKMSAEHYKTDPLTSAILKQDIDKYLDVDSIVVEIRGIADEQEKIVKFLENSKSMVRQRGFDIKTAIDFRKLMSGL